MKNMNSLALSALLTASCSLFLSNLALADTKMAITIDDLPVHGEITPGTTRTEIAKSMIAVLKRHGVSEAYGFINGLSIDNEQENLNVLSTWVDAGFPLGNHTFSHVDLAKMSAKDFITDLEKNEPILKQYSQAMDYHFFRFPYLSEGDTLDKRNQIRKYFNKKRYKVAEVTVDFQDYEWNDPYVRCEKSGNRDQINWLKQSYVDQALDRLNFARVLGNNIYGRDINQVLLLHIGQFDSIMLDDVLTAYENKGVTFVSLSEALSDQAYQVDTGYVAKDGTTFLDQIAGKKEVVYPPFNETPEANLQTLCL